MKLRRLATQLWQWRRLRQERSDVAEEMALHQELRARQIHSEGRMDAGEAATQAARQFGNQTWLIEEASNAWRWIWLDDLGKDVRHALRAMWTHPIFTATAILTLAIGVGANTAIFSVMNALLLRTLPVPAGDRIYNVFSDGQPDGMSDTGDAATSFSYPVAERLRRTHPELWTAMAYVPLGLNKISLRFGSVPVEGSAEMVSGNFFSGLEIPMACGRPILAADEGAPIAVLNAGFAAAQFGSACAALGRQVRIRGVVLTVVGVAEARFEGAGRRRRMSGFLFSAGRS